MGSWQSKNPNADLAQTLKDVKAQNKSLQEQMSCMQKEHNDKVAELKKEKGEFMQEVKRMKEQAEKPKREYNRIVKAAHDIVGRAGLKVALVFGCQGAGKSTICKYMFGIDDAKAGTGHTHVTTELTLHQSNKVPFNVVDTIGKMPDIRGMMRVLACAYNRGWDPSALIVVHSGRTGHFDAVASFLQASKINAINFEPKTFYRMKSRGMESREGLELTVFKDKDSLPRINSMSASNYTIEECATSDNLLIALNNLDWDKAQQATEFEGIANTLAFYLAKSIVERADFAGDDLAFIDR